MERNFTMPDAQRIRPGHDETMGLHNASAAESAPAPGVTRALSFVDRIGTLQSVRIHLLDQDKPVSAASIGAALGLEHEELYGHLVRLDALGQARGGVWLPGVTSGHRYGWEAV
jgi:hypothetical protein